MSRKLRVLHLPSNIASIPSYTVSALRTIQVDARGMEFAYDAAPFSRGESIEFVRRPYRAWSPRWVPYAVAFLRALVWADVIHWYYDTRVLPWGLDLQFVQLLGKPAFVEWMGSELRDPLIELEDNPVFTDVWPMKASLTPSSHEYTRAAQERFAAAGFKFLVHTGMRQYLLPEFDNRSIDVERAIPVSQYRTAYPGIACARPVIAHSPSSMSLKGSEFVDAAVESVRHEMDFEYDMIHGVSHDEALHRVARADIFLDQFIVGDFGMASMEAMALGKPVVCYVKPSLRRAYPDGLPIVNATPSTLPAVLRELLADAQRRRALGVEGREYVERNCDVTVRASRLKKIYLDSLATGA